MKDEDGNPTAAMNLGEMMESGYERVSVYRENAPSNKTATVEVKNIPEGRDVTLEMVKTDELEGDARFINENGEKVTSITVSAPSASVEVRGTENSEAFGNVQVTAKWTDTQAPIEGIDPISFTVNTFPINFRLDGTTPSSPVTPARDQGQSYGFLAAMKFESESGEIADLNRVIMVEIVKELVGISKDENPLPFPAFGRLSQLTADTDGARVRIGGGRMWVTSPLEEKTFLLETEGAKSTPISDLHPQGKFDDMHAASVLDVGTQKQNAGSGGQYKDQQFYAYFDITTKSMILPEGNSKFDFTIVVVVSEDGKTIQVIKTGHDGQQQSDPMNLPEQ